MTFYRHRVRPARPADASALTSIHVEGGLNAHVGPGWLRMREDLARRLESGDPRLIAYVVELTDHGLLATAAVGFVEHTLCRPGNPLGREARLASLATLHAYRGRGYARRALTAFITEAERRGCPAITLTATEAAQALYERVGFSPRPRAMRLDLTTHTAAPPPPPARPRPVALPD